MTVQKRLYRSVTDRKIFGICGGVADYFDIDPTIVRLALVLLCFITAFIPVTLGYVISALIVPDAPRS